HLAAGGHEGSAPLRQTFQRSHRAGRDDFCSSHLGTNRLLFCSPPDDTNVRQPERFDGSLEERTPTEQRLDQGDLQVWPGNRERHTWEARPATDVKDVDAVGDQFGYDRAIENVT